MLVNACVARPVNAKERIPPLALAAMKKEWDRPRAQSGWGESGVREWAHAACEAADAGTKAHVGVLFAICVEEGPSFYYNTALNRMLFIYVVDFKMSGPTKNLDKGCAMLQRHLDIEPPQAMSLYPACTHEVDTARIPEGSPVVTLVYITQEFFESCVQRCAEVKGHGEVSCGYNPVIGRRQVDEGCAFPHI